MIDAARGSDANARVALLSAAQPGVRRYAARNCRAADIDDAVQETLLLLYRRSGTLRAAASFSAWIFAVGAARLSAPDALVEADGGGVKRRT